MAVLLKPGSKGPKVLKAKRWLRRWLVKKGRRADARKIVLTPRYGPKFAAAVQDFQRKKGLKADGVIGPKTWDALRYAVNPNAGKVLRGIPWRPGVLELDGNWLNAPMVKRLRRLRKAGTWTGQLYSGWRPDWYQKILFDAAVKKYGSYAEASKWVAPPGKSNHRFRDRRGAADLTNAWQAKGRLGFYQPMSWEPWHLQLSSSVRAAVRSLLGASDEPMDDTMPDGVDMDAVLASVEQDLAELDERPADTEVAPGE